STHEKLGPAVTVPPQSLIHCIQLPGLARKSCGAACTSWHPAVIGIDKNPTSPMSWYSGSHDTITSWSPISAARQQASMFAASTRSGIITPLGSLVDPLVYCRITKRSGSCEGISNRSPLGAVDAPDSTALIGSSGGSPIVRS